LSTGGSGRHSAASAREISARADASRALLHDPEIAQTAYTRGLNGAVWNLAALVSPTRATDGRLSQRSDASDDFDFRSARDERNGAAPIRGERGHLDLLAEVDRVPVVELGSHRLPRIDP
jgi:hypothetical protein